MKTIRRMKGVLVLVLIGWTCFLRAQVTETWSGDVGSRTYTTNTTVTLEGTVTLKGTININNGVTLTILTDGTDKTIIRGCNGTLFNVKQGSTLILGHSAARIVINGGAEFSLPESGSDEAHQDATSTLTNNPYTGYIIYGNGNLAMNSVTIQQCYYPNEYGCAIFCFNDGGLQHGAVPYVTLTDCIIKGIRCGSGPALYSKRPDMHDITMTNTEVKWCYVYRNLNDAGGIINTNGGTKSSLVMDSCRVHHNKTKGNGGGVAWLAGGRGETSKLTLKNNTSIHHNVADRNGGGIILQSTMDIQSAQIYNNSAANGGGISIETYNGGNAAYEGKGIDFTVDTGVYIYNNTATSLGGGVYVTIYGSNDVGFDPSGNPINVVNEIKMTGGKVYGNTAAYGAGMAIEDRAPNKYYNPTYNIYSGDYRSIISILGGEIYGNNCNTSSVSVKGGGLYIRKYADSSVNYGIDPSTGETVTGGRITIKTMNGLIYNNKARNTIYDGIGGGMYINNEISQAPYNAVCNMDIGGSVKFYGNESDNGGAGVYIANGNVTVSGGTIGKSGHPNIAHNGNGAGVAIVNGDLTVNGGNIDYNEARYNHNQGGNGGAIYLTGGVATINGGTVSYNAADMNGGGFYVSTGASSAITTISNGAMISGNSAVGGFGGGFYLDSGILEISGDSTAIKGNHASNQGGGIYVGGGTFTMTGGTIGGTTVDTVGGNYTTSADSYGGGIFMGSGTASISNSTISGNYTCSRTSLSGCGGAIYMNGGICTLSNGANIGGTDSNYANTSKYGGAVYSANGIITVKGGIIGYNNAEKGGGIYANGDNAKVYVQKSSSKGDVLSYIQHNTAQYGGGIYGEKGRVEFSDGYIQFNTASEQGGGIYVDANDTLYMKGSANLFLNGVPTGHKGGGVYLLGSLIVGEQTSALGTILAQDNYAYTTTRPDTLASSTGQHVATSLRNNVYLPNPVVHTYSESTHAGVIEVVENGISDASRVGFSVPHGNVPVIYCTRSGSSWGYLHNFSTGQPLQFNLFDDSGRYRSVQYSNDPTFDPDHVYLFGFWTDEVTGGSDDYCTVNMDDFVGQDTIFIDSPCKLAFFISWVNGRTTPSITPHPTVCAKLMDDIDMSEFVWVPIGNGGGYGGVFDGNGHTVTGIRHLLNDTHTNYGFFGNLTDGAVVKNLFLKGEHFHIEKKLGYHGTMYIGGVAGLTSGNTTIENCESSSVIIVDPDNPNTVMGGLVGKSQTGDLISSCIGIADMNGFLMGGLTGQNGGQMFNSFANAKFTSNGTLYFGGLAGENTGIIENCYVRLSGAEPADTTNFGYLVGNNTGGNVNYCYSPVDTRYFKTNGGTVNGSGHYDDNAIAPRLYRHRDTQVTISTDIDVNTGSTDNRFVPTEITNPNPLLPTDVDQQLMLCLERWVDTMNIKHSGHYAHWDRTTTKVINNDLPILKMNIVDGHDTPIVNAVYCTGNADGTENEAFLNYGEVNDLLLHTADSVAIWLYRSKSGINGNKGSHAKLYIDEGVTVIQNDSLYAYVGVTLDNSANINGAPPTFGDVNDYTDWHMFSTPLANAPLGVHYTDFDGSNWAQYGNSFSYTHPTGMPYYQFYNNEEAAVGDEDWERRGYFPSHRYGVGYAEVNSGPTTGGNYYNEWDFYTYYEPEYHWINFKRNPNNHWHQNAMEEPIVYMNETQLTRGRGYLLATREETFLQCHGLLNGSSGEGEISIPVTYSGAYSPGYNFLGNPYLAYLDFDAFASVNGDLWGVDTLANYAVIDEDNGGYIYYALRSSENPYLAPRYIAPHQGFMILVVDTIAANSTADFYSDGSENMRVLTVADGKFRGAEQPAYPLVNLIATDNNGNRDIVTVELGRPDRGGAPLMRELRQCKGHVWCHYEGKDWAIAFTQPGLSEAAIRFETYEDGEYTMRWNTQNGEFSYLHLIDNFTGADIDCLTTDEYRFTSTMTDFKSRFRLVFGYTGIEDPETGEPAQDNFAYQSGDALVVTGEGTVELFDVTGRRMATQRIEGVQGTVNVSGLTSGVYLLRLATTTGTRVQKIVINQ